MGGNRTLRGGGSITSRKDFGVGVMDGVKKIHHSDELLLGPTKAIRDFILDGDVSCANSVLEILGEQKRALGKIDLSKVDEVSFDKFKDAVSRLELITRVFEDIHDYKIHEALGFGYNRKLKAQNFNLK